MALIVGIHGIGQQLKGENVVHAKWLPPLRDGLKRVGVDFLDDKQLSCAFYGDLFRKKGKKGVGDPLYDASDITEDWETEMLETWWSEAARAEKAVPGPGDKTKLGRTPKIVQRALNALSNSKFFAGIAEQALIFDLKQVDSYLHNQEIRHQI